MYGLRLLVIIGRKRNGAVKVKNDDGYNVDFGFKKMDKKNVLVSLMVILISVLVVMFITGLPDGESYADTVTGYTHAPIQFKDFTIELTDSESDGDNQTFYFMINNTGDSPVPTYITSFDIKNGAKSFSSDMARFEESELNPGMSTTGKVTFVMNSADLNGGTPIMTIEHGLFFDEEKEFELVKR